jgi:hypothetical protein
MLNVKGLLERPRPVLVGVFFLLPGSILADGWGRIGSFIWAYLVYFVVGMGNAS